MWPVTRHSTGTPPVATATGQISGRGIPGHCAGRVEVTPGPVAKNDPANARIVAGIRAAASFAHIATDDPKLSSALARGAVSAMAGQVTALANRATPCVKTEDMRNMVDAIIAGGMNRAPGTPRGARDRLPLDR